MKAWPKQGKIKKKRNPATTRPLQPWSEALFSVWPESGSPGTLRTARCWALLVVGVVGGVVLVRGGCWSCGEWRQDCLRWWTEAPLTRTRVHRRWAGLLRLLLGTRTRLLRGGWAIFLRWLCGWGWLTSGDVVGQLATKAGWVEGQTGRATLKPWVASHAKPVTHAALLNGDVTVGTVLANGVLLTVWHIVGPVAGVHDIVVKEREGTLLDGGGSVPALPVTGAACLVGEHTVLPVAILGALWRLSHDATVIVGASDTVWVITVVQETSVLAREGESVRTELHGCDAVFALVVVVAVLLVLKHSVVFATHIVLASLAGHGADERRK